MQNYRSGLPKLVTKMGFGTLRIQGYHSWLLWVKDSKLPKCVTEEGNLSGLWWVKDSELSKWVIELGNGGLRIQSYQSGLTKGIIKKGFGRLRIQSYQNGLWWVKGSCLPNRVYYILFQFQVRNQNSLANFKQRNPLLVTTLTQGNPV